MPVMPVMFTTLRAETVSDSYKEGGENIAFITCITGRSMANECIEQLGIERD